MTLRKQQAALANVDQITGAKIPKSFVFSRGKLPSTLRHLQQDLRKVMLPYTALNLKEKKRNNLKDYVNVAGPLGVTHFLILSNPKSLPHLRFSNSPQGPTFTFQIEEYALAADIANSQKRPRCPPGIFKNSPLVEAAKVVLSGFSGPGNPFESLHWSSTFSIWSLPLTQVLSGYGSESEVDDEAAMVSLPSDVDKLNKASRKSAVRLQEIEPRMTMRLVKVEAGLCSGYVLYPWPVAKESVRKKGKATEEEIEEQEETEDVLRMCQRTRRRNSNLDALMKALTDHQASASKDSQQCEATALF
ncbi:Peter Pan-like protein [Dichanthelium oligosanthes]|uniref:Peter Pan-like protein n=1 Tax=Dichanthelium oligosanthes TaxID=888268 RepID=A0A1E5WET9_9POAL|nr:Peter Pan-like protein [Dichanthelium oligosanthes]